ncbi:molecular chaperone DnaK [candidate division WOR-3 bacterium]|uniref:Chaperone protein DnaK n=1 Tax=candidate division WOR-3 bacterium TaxID=2052148 RepID=A0A9D5KBI1_UNCW3|nr:molecular chaperone DnaK [candidate division WOR-3 bacterium]MBD3364716.1 molecular chaperone DnaK [candidate division WOR-3 bacterium]
MSKVIGIDLGTTNSCVAVVEGGQPVVIPNPEGGRTTPSVISFGKERLVGTLAKRQAVLHPDETVYSIKRFMGRRFSEAADERKKVSYNVVAADNGDAWVEVAGRKMAPPELSAMILQYLKKSAEDYLGEKVTQAVISVPAYFNDSQRQATKDAGKIAGLEVQRIINEPTAAALAYGLDKGKSAKVAVYDLGGGTFDISIIEIDAEAKTIEVLATNGNTQLGGDDFDQRIMDYIIKEFQTENGVDLSADRSSLARVKEAAEKAKKELSTKFETTLSQPFIASDADKGPLHLEMNMTRTKLESLVGDLVEQSFGPVKQALEDAKLTPADISEVILVGGQTRMPMVQQNVKDFFGKEPHKGINPDEVVAIGAAQAAFQASGQADQESSLLLLDVAPLSLGIETLGEVMTTLIPRNTTIPTKKTQTFTTAADNQSAVTVHVLQGERPMARDNRTLGKFNLEGIPPAPRGVPQIEVTFDIDENGILHVSAKDKGTGKEQKITITASSGLSEEEVEKMVKDAETHASEDRKHKELIDARNQADSMIHSVEKAMRDAGDKLSDADRKEIDSKIAALKEASKGEDISAIKKATEELQQASYKISEILYKQQQGEGPQAGPQAGPQPGPGPQQGPKPGPQADTGKDEEDVQADYEVIDDEEENKDNK